MEPLESLVVIVAIGAVALSIFATVNLVRDVVATATTLCVSLLTLKAGAGELATKLQGVAATAVDALQIMSAVQKLLDDKQLVVVAHDHWLTNVLCETKRMEHQTLLKKEEANTAGDSIPFSLEDRKTSYLTELLADTQQRHTLIQSSDDVKALSERVVRLASVFSELLPAYEPLLIEVALVHSLHEWSSSSRQSSDDGDMVAADFEAYFLTQLQSDHARNWFNCEFFIDSLDILFMAPLFYKQRIENQALKDLISIATVEARGDYDEFSFELLLSLVDEKNQAALQAWTAWLGQEIVTVGSLRRETTTHSESLFFLREKLLNATQLHTDQRAYFPTSVEIINCFASMEFRDLSGVVSAHSAGSSICYAGFIYHGGELPKQVHELANESHQQQQDNEERLAQDGSYEIVENEQDDETTPLLITEPKPIVAST